MVIEGKREGGSNHSQSNLQWQEFIRNRVRLTWQVKININNQVVAHVAFHTVVSKSGLAAWCHTNMTTKNLVLYLQERNYVVGDRTKLNLCLRVAKLMTSRGHDPREQVSLVSILSSPAGEEKSVAGEEKSVTVEEDEQIEVEKLLPTILESLFESRVDNERFRKLVRTQLLGLKVKERSIDNFLIYCFITGDETTINVGTAQVAFQTPFNGSEWMIGEIDNQLVETLGGETDETFNARIQQLSVVESAGGGGAVSVAVSNPSVLGGAAIEEKSHDQKSICRIGFQSRTSIRRLWNLPFCDGRPLKDSFGMWSYAMWKLRRQGFCWQKQSIMPVLSRSLPCVQTIEMFLIEFFLLKTC